MSRKDKAVRTYDLGRATGPNRKTRKQKAILDATARISPFPLRAARPPRANPPVIRRTNMRTRHPDPAARPPERLCATVPATRVQPNATPCNIPAKSLRPARPSSHNPTPLARNEPTACYKKLQIATTLSIAPRAPAQNKPTADRTPHAGAQRRERKRPNAAPDSSDDQSHPPAQIKPTKRAKQCQTTPPSAPAQNEPTVAHRLTPRDAPARLR